MVMDFDRKRLLRQALLKAFQEEVPPPSERMLTLLDQMAGALKNTGSQAARENRLH